MSGTQKLAQCIESMTECLERVKTDGLALSDMMVEFSKAIEAYKQYQSHFSDNTMDVVEIRMENGKLIENEYAWHDM